VIRMACLVAGLCGLVIGGVFVLFAVQSAVLRLAHTLHPELVEVGVVLAALGAVLFYVGKRLHERS
jgi:hypothetical protein